MFSFSRRKICVVGEKTKVTGDRSFKYYKKKSLYRDKSKIKTQKDHAKVLNAIYRNVRKSAIEYEGGVYDKTYFYIIPQPCFTRNRMTRVPESKGVVTTMNLQSDGFAYTLLFCNLLRTKTSFFYEISKTFRSSFRQMFSKFMFEYSPKYIFSLATLKNIKN